MATPRKKPEEKLKTGRPRKTAVDAAVTKAICDNLELAMPIELAAEEAGVPARTARQWALDIPEFAAAVTRARARGAKLLVVRTLGGGKGSSNAAWTLERRYREHYGAVTKIVTEEATDYDKMSQEELEAERQRLLAKMSVRHDY